MTHASSPISACRHCQFYSPEGRRGGHCRKLNVSVQSRWDACSLGVPPFAATWRELESIAVWKQKVLSHEELSLVVEGSISSDLFVESEVTPAPLLSRRTLPTSRIVS